MRALLAITLGISITAGTATIAQQDQCGDVFRFSAFNRNDFSASTSILSSSKDSMCNRDFTSETDLQQYARSGGWSLSYGLLSNALTDAKNESSGRVDIHASEFCSLSLQELDAKQRVQESVVTTDNAVAAWSACMQRAQLPYAIYDLSDDGRIASGDILRDGVQGSTELFLTGISIDPENSATCTVAGKPINADVGKGGFEIKQTRTTLSCSKSSSYNGSVRVGIQTSEGSVGPIEMPSQRSVDLKFSDAQELISTLSAREVTLQSEVDGLSSDVNQLKGLLASTEAQRDQFLKRHNANIFSVYAGDGGSGALRGQPDFWARCGTPVDSSYGVAQCATKNMDYWTLLKVGTYIHGGGCSQVWYTLLCQAR